MAVVKNKKWLNQTDHLLPYLFQTPHSEETKKRISESNKGKGHPHSEETKKKMSLLRKGRPSPRRGKTYHPHSEETKRKIGLSSKNRKHSEETKKKMSDAKRR